MVPLSVGNPRLDPGIGKASVEFLVELVDDFDGRVLGAPTPNQAVAS